MSLVFLCNRTGPSPFLRDGHFIRQLKSNLSTVLKAAEANALALVTSHQQPTALVMALDRLGDRITLELKIGPNAVGIGAVRRLANRSPASAWASAVVRCQPGGEVGGPSEIEQGIGQGLQLLQGQGLDAGAGGLAQGAAAAVELAQG